MSGNQFEGISVRWSHDGEVSRVHGRERRLPEPIPDQPGGLSHGRGRDCEISAFPEKISARLMIRFVPIAGSDEDAGVDEEHSGSDAAANFFSAPTLRAPRMSNGSASVDAPTPMKASSGSSSSSAMKRSTRTCGSTQRRWATASSFAASSLVLDRHGDIVRHRLSQ